MNVKNLTFLALLFISAQTIVGQQIKTVKIHQTPGFITGTCEPSISVNPADPNNLVAASVLNNVYYSRDGGFTWEKGKIKSSFGVWGDPCIVHDASGRAYYFHLSDPTGKNWQSDSILDRIVVQWSDDGGKSWSDGSFMGLNHPKDQDKEWAAVNLETGEVVVTWTQFDKYNSPDEEDKSNILFSRSIDRGETWSDPIAINEISGNCLDDDQTVEGAVPSFGPNGEIYVAWSYDEKIYFNHTKKSGTEWNEENTFVAKQPGGWTMNIPGLNRTNGMPVTAVDNSEGPYRGRIYVMWGDIRHGETNADIFLAHSDDNGETFSTPTKVNQDTTNTHQFLPWMSIDNKTGAVYSVYYDRSNYTNDSTDVIFTYSQDGGLSWQHRKINLEGFSVNPKVFFGDYNNITSRNGKVYPIWTEFHKGYLSVWTAIIDLTKEDEE